LPKRLCNGFQASQQLLLAILNPYELSEALRPLSVRLGPTSGNDEIKKKVGFLSFGEIKRKKVGFLHFHDLYFDRSGS
jgi:hypothetical protein